MKHRHPLMPWAMLTVLAGMASGYSYSGRLTYGSYKVGAPEQLRLVHVPNPQPYLAFYGNTTMPDPSAACTVTWVSQLTPSNNPVFYQSDASSQGDNASVYFSQLQLRHPNKPWAPTIHGYSSIYVESRCGTPRLISSVEVLDCLQGSRADRQFEYRLRNTELRGPDPKDMSPVNDWSVATRAKLPPHNTEGETHVAMIADMTDIDYNTSIPGIQACVSRGEIDAVMHGGDVAYDVDDDCGIRGDEFMRSISGISSRVPYIFGPGDHEGGRKDLVNTNCGGDYEALKARLSGGGGGGSPGQLGLSHGSGSPSPFYFSFDVGLIHFAVVNSNAWVYACQHWMLKPMYKWLEGDLQSVNRSQTPWVVLVSHRQAYCVKSSDSECNQEAGSLRYGPPAEAIARGMNIFDGWYPKPLHGYEQNMYGLEDLVHRYKVDIQFGGHTHHYERSWPVFRNVVQQKHYHNPNATVYVQGGISGVSPDEFELPFSPFQAFRDESYAESWGKLSAWNQTHLTWRQIFAVNGSTLDTFDIIKDVVE